MDSDSHYLCSSCCVLFFGCEQVLSSNQDGFLPAPVEPLWLLPFDFGYVLLLGKEVRLVLIIPYQVNLTLEFIVCCFPIIND